MQSRFRISVASAFLIITSTISGSIADALPTLDISGDGTYGLTTVPGPFSRVILPVSLTSTPWGNGGITFFGQGALTQPEPAVYGGGFDYSAILSGQGDSTFGRLSATVSFESKAGPELRSQIVTPLNPAFSPTVISVGHAESIANVNLTFKDSGVVTSTTLPLGTPITVNATVVDKGFGIYFGHRMGVLDSNNNSDGLIATGFLKLFDQTTRVTTQPSYQGGITTYPIASFVGSRIDLQNTFHVGAAGLAGRDGFSGGNSPFAVQVFGSLKASADLYLSGPAGFGFVSDSGHDYLYVPHLVSIAPSVLAQGGVTLVPGGGGSAFRIFDRAVGSSGANSVFHAYSTTGEDGIYTADGGALAVVADLNTPIPASTGNFASFRINGIPTEPCRSGDNVVFAASGAGNQQRGIYARINGTLQRVADLTVPVPQGSGNFTGFGGNQIPGDPCISGDQVVFVGLSLFGPSGVYGLTGGSLVRIADASMPVPGGTGSFTSFVVDGNQTSPVISGNTVLFYATGGDGQQGIYRATIGSPDAVAVADRTTPIPGRSTLFTHFRSFAIDPVDPTRYALIGGDNVGLGVYASASGGPLIPVIDAGTLFPGTTSPFGDFSAVAVDLADVAFLGSSQQGDQGLFAKVAGVLYDLINVGDTVDGKIVSTLELSATGLTHVGAVPQVAYRASFSDGTSALYTTAVPVPEPAIVAQVVSGMAACTLFHRRRRRRRHFSGEQPIGRRGVAQARPTE